MCGGGPDRDSEEVSRSQQRRTEMSSMVDAGHPRSASALRNVQLLVGGYLAISVLTLITIIALRNNAAAVNDAVWVRGTPAIEVLTSPQHDYTRTLLDAALELNT